MKKAKTLQEQIAELTEDQKNNMGKIYKKYVISIAVILVISICTIVGLLVTGSIREEKAKEKYDRIQTQIAMNERLNIHDFSLLDESSEASDAYYDIIEQKYLSIGIVAGVGFVGLLIIYFIFKRKYPYFSEKKYAYLKKMKKGLQ